jgi:methyltransferase
MVTAKIYLALLALVTLERLVELVISRRNEAWVKLQGGLEFGRRHFGFMKVLHTAFLISCAVEVVLLERPFHPALGLAMIGVLLLAQALRYWSIFTLGHRWNVRIFVVPEAPLVTEGPYRYLRHPNYLAVILEVFAIPLIHSAWITATTFTFLNGLMLAERIRCEENALREHSVYNARLEATPRLLPVHRGLKRP